MSRPTNKSSKAYFTEAGGKSEIRFQFQTGREKVDDYISTVSKAVTDLSMLEEDFKKVRRKIGTTKAPTSMEKVKMSQTKSAAFSYKTMSEDDVDISTVEKAIILHRNSKCASRDNSTCSKAKEISNKKRENNCSSIRLRDLAKPKKRGLCIFAQRVLPSGSLPPSSIGSSFLVVLPPSVNSLRDVCERISRVIEENLQTSQPEIKDLYNERSDRLMSFNEIKDGCLLSYRCVGDLCPSSQFNRSQIKTQKELCKRLALPKPGYLLRNITFQHSSACGPVYQRHPVIFLPVIPPGMCSLEQLFAKLEIMITDNFTDLPTRPIRELFKANNFERVDNLVSLESEAHYYFSCFGDLSNTVSLGKKQSCRPITSKKSKKLRRRSRKKKKLHQQNAKVHLTCARPIDTIDLYIHDIL